MRMARVYGIKDLMRTLGDTYGEIQKNIEIHFIQKKKSKKLIPIKYYKEILTGN